MTIRQIIDRQGWVKVDNKEGVDQFELESGRDTIKIHLLENTDLEQAKLIKNKLWNEYYPRIFLYKNSQNKFLVWANSQSPKVEGKSYDEKPFDEQFLPVEYWEKYILKTPSNTVDKILKKSILIIFKKLKEKEYSDDDAIAIILACTFIRFLEDRDLSDVKNKLIDSLRSKDKVIRLFKEYNTLHNGMLFKNEILYSIDKDVCGLLLDFLRNKLSAQLSLFNFNFKYIPVELISSVYEELLTEKLGDKTKKDQGIAYTPPRLANYVVKEAFKQLEEKQKDFSKLKIADLSVGSGIFLVLSFRKLVEKLNNNRKKSFDEKVQILKNSLYGTDLDPSAKNITIFSLYVELLENENKKLSRSNKFPRLDNIKSLDTLDYLDNKNFFDLVIGNPPWRSGDSVSYSKIEKRDFCRDVCNKEIAQIFTHISLEKIKEGGVLSLILPTAIFYNFNSSKFRNSILNKSIVKSFVDFSALRSVLFKNGVEPSVLIVEKNSDKIKNDYIVTVSRALNKADYLYFNHVSGEINYINSNFLMSRKDSWQIAVRGGSAVARFVERLNTDFVCLSDVGEKDIQIGTGYQATDTTISSKCSDGFLTPIYVVENGEILKKFTSLKRISKSHIEFNKAFYNQCIGIGNSYKYKKGLVFDYFLADNNRVLSGDFNIVSSADKKLLFFLLGVLTSRLGEFFVSIMGAKTGLLSSEVKDPKIQGVDIRKILIPRDYSRFKEIIKIGERVSEKKDVDVKFINVEIEKVYKLNELEKQILEKWEMMTNRNEKGNKVFENYRVGFERMLLDFDLERPRKWDIREKNGVQIISFTGDNKFVSNKFCKEEFNKIMTAKKNFSYKFRTDDECLILRRKDSNFGYMTGLSDAEHILSTL